MVARHITSTIEQKGNIINTMHAEWLPTILQGSFSEIYVLNCNTLHFEYVNPTACKNLQYSLDELTRLSPTCLARNVSEEAYAQFIRGLQDGSSTSIAINTEHTRKDGSSYPIEFQLFYLASDTAPSIIAIGNDVSSRDKSDKALRASESRLSAMVSNTPGLVYQFRLRKDCLLYTSPSPRDQRGSRMPSSA